MPINEDELLYKDFLKGNDEAFNELIRRNRRNLILYINGYVKNIDVVEDISQDVFIYVLANRKEYDFKYSFKTYLYTIARCRVINYINKSKKEVFLGEELEFLPDETSIDDNLISEERKDIVLKALSKLKNEYRKVIYLKDFECFSYKEICKILGKTMPQVKVLIHRARASLKKIIEEEGNINDR